MESSRSPRDVMVVAYRLGNKHLAQYASRFSRKDFTLPQLFACLALRQFYNLSYRRTEALLADAGDLRRAVRLRRAPDHNTLCDAFGTLARLDVFAPMLDELAAAFEAAGLLRLGERPLAADGTYFESRHVSRHFERRRRDTTAAAAAVDKAGSATRADAVRGLPKLGIAVACACHLVLSVWAGTGAGSDHPHFEPLVYHAWRRAPVSTVVADAGYDSEAAHELVREDLACAASLIPPRIGRPTDKPPATFYRALAARLLADDPAAKAAYGQRWQAETVNSMLKRNYGSALRAATEERREREMLLKVMVHNIALA
jgi:hypothetical protein